MRGLRPSLGAAASLLAAAAGLWVLASALLGLHAWPGGPADHAPGVARLPPVTRPAKLTSRHTATKPAPVTPARRTRVAAPRRRTPHHGVARVEAPPVRTSPPAAATPSPSAPSSTSPAAAPTAAATPVPGPVSRAVATVTAPVASVVPAPVQTVVGETAATVDGLLGGG